MTLKILDYNANSYVITCANINDKNKHTDIFKSLGSRWSPRLKCGAGWIFNKNKVDVDKLKKLVIQLNSDDGEDDVVVEDGEDDDEDVEDEVSEFKPYINDVSAFKLDDDDITDFKLDDDVTDFKLDTKYGTKSHEQSLYSSGDSKDKPRSTGRRSTPDSKDKPRSTGRRSTFESRSSRRKDEDLYLKEQPDERVSAKPPHFGHTRVTSRQVKHSEHGTERRRKKTYDIGSNSDHLLLNKRLLKLFKKLTAMEKRIAKLERSK